MKTVIVDSSLCASTLRADARTEDIKGYLRALSNSGIKYAELDFRTLMNFRELPKGIGYIFRVVDPMFIKITEAFDFSYIVVTLSDLRTKIKTKIPVMLELPYVKNTYKGVLRYAQQMLGGMVTAVRFCDDFGYKDLDETRKFVSELRNNIPLPIDFCPKNTRKTALDCALKFTLSNADSISLAMPETNFYASLEEYIISMISFYDIIPNGFDIREFFRAILYYKRIFRNPENADISRIFDLSERDSRMMVNADTGEKAKFNMIINNTNMLGKNFRSALEKMIKSTNADEETFEALRDAVKYFDASLCSDSVLYDEHKGFLN